MAFIYQVKVVPASGKQMCILDKQGKLKCFLKSAPEKGAANKELIKFFSKVLGVAQNDIEIVAGLTSKLKTIKIHTLFTQGELLKRLGLDQQETLF